MIDSSEDCLSPTSLHSEASFVTSCVVSDSGSTSLQRARLERTTTFALTTYGRVHSTPRAWGSWPAGLEPHSHLSLDLSTVGTKWHSYEAWNKRSPHSIPSSSPPWHGWRGWKPMGFTTGNPLLKSMWSGAREVTSHPPTSPLLSHFTPTLPYHSRHKDPYQADLPARGQWSTLFFTASEKGIRFFEK